MAVRKKQTGAASVHVKTQLRAIRRLASPVPDRTAEERLEKIAGIANGTLTPEMGRLTTSPDLMERLRAGQASRSPRVGDPKPEPKPKRAQRAGHDRQERSGTDRAEG